MGVSDCRSRFPIFERLTYVNSCSQGALSDAVRQAYAVYLTGWVERGVARLRRLAPAAKRR